MTMYADQLHSTDPPHSDLVPEAQRYPANRRSSEQFERLTPIRAMFQARCEARGILFTSGELNLHKAVDGLQDDAVALGLVPRLGRDLSREDARQIAENVTGFFAILAEWSRAEMPVPANDTGKTSASDNEEASHER